ncbi:MAG: helix-turn-helix transcriptional regulator [Bacilli bacterium]
MSKNNLYKIRESNDLKAKDIATCLNVSRSNYSEWENNKTPIPTRRIIELADFYEINIDYLLNLSPHKIEIKTPSKINLIKIGKRIKEARSELYLTLREIVKKLNCSYSAFAAYERGESLINSETLLSLCTLTNYSIDYILGRTNTKYLNK